MKFFYGYSDNMMPYSAFHIIFILFFLILTPFVVQHFHNSSDKTFKKIILVAWLILVLFEIGKQLNWGTDLHTREWKGLALRAFPYQFCSLPYYVWPLVIFLPESKLKNAVSLFTGTLVFLTGFGYIFVGASLCGRIFINHQTMIHHGTQATISLLIFAHEYKKFETKTHLYSFFILVFFTALAIGLNVAIGKIYPNSQICLWELNPLDGFKTEVPFYRNIMDITGFPVFILLYIVVFYLLGLGFYFLESLLIKVNNRFISTNKKSEHKIA